MLTLQIKFDHCADPSTGLAAIRFRAAGSALRLQGDLLHIPTEKDQHFRFGRGWGCEVFLLDPDTYARRLSSEHLQIEVASQICFVRDLATKNGTRLNGAWVGVPPAPHRSRAERSVSDRRRLKVGDVIGLPGLTLTVIEVPPVRPLPAGSASPSPGPLEAPAHRQPDWNPAALRTPPLVVFRAGDTPHSPPVLDGFEFAATLGGKPASGLTYLYEPVKGGEADGGKWVVKYFHLPPPVDRESLQLLIRRYYSVANAALHPLNAYSLAAGSGAAHLGLCFPQVQNLSLARSPFRDLPGIYDVLRGVLEALADLHQHGLAHGHICAANLFPGDAGKIVLTDAGLNGLRAQIGAELTGPPPSPRGDLAALGDLCLDLLGVEPSETAPEVRHRQHLDSVNAWPGGPLQALARRLRHDAHLTSGHALQLILELPRLKADRLLTAPQWKPSQNGRP